MTAFLYTYYYKSQNTEHWKIGHVSVPPIHQIYMFLKGLYPWYDQLGAWETQRNKVFYFGKHLEERLPRKVWGLLEMSTAQHTFSRLCV